MKRDDRDGRDAAGVGPYARARETLVTLTSLGSWDVSDGDPDIRGWEVQTVSGRQLGKVAELLVDPEAGEVVMLDVDLPGTDHHSLVPIRVAQIDRTRRVVLLDSADLPEVSELRDASSAAPVVVEAPVPARVSFPRADREVSVGQLAAPDVEAADAAARRDAERRIERMNTDL